MALAMIEGGRRGTLRPGQCVVEYTAGRRAARSPSSAGEGLSPQIVSSDAFAAEKLRTMAAFGADVELILSPDGITPDLVPAMRRRAAEIVEQEGAFATDQFNNRDALDGYRVIGDEILRQLPGPIDAVCVYVGVGGCFVGVSEVLHGAWPALERIAVEPAESAVLSGGSPGTHRIEGGGVGFVPPHMTTAELDGVEAVSTAGAFAMARRAARRRACGPDRRAAPASSPPSVSPNASAPTTAW
jgi:cysteine synthase A